MSSRLYCDDFRLILDIKCFASSKIVPIDVTIWVVLQLFPANLPNLQYFFDKKIGGPTKCPTLELPTTIGPINK
jgi:hypothetical protein